ncbi:glycosyltransferase family 4 protein [bacterium]|nr:glycosyltransferase family 4 protein [bacterium]
MRILLIIDSLTIGGAERIVINLAKHFVKKGNSVAILTLRNANYFKNELKNIPVFCVNKKGKIDFTTIYKIRSIIKKFKPDMINTHLFSASFWTKLSILFEHIPLFEVHHNVLWQEIWYTIFHKIANKLTNFKVTRHIFVSKDVIDFYHIIEKIDGDIIYNGIEIKNFDFSIKKDKHALLFVGRLIERKGIKDLLEIKKKLPSEYKLTICGIGPMKKYILKNKDDNTFFIEGCDSKSVFVKAGLLLMPSYWEGFGIVILEALASGVPLITYNVKGNINNPLKSYLHLIKKGNIDDFVNSILNYSYDYDKIEKARNEIEKYYTLEKMGDSYLEVFKKYVD